MFTCPYTVRLRDTDAAGLLYFTEQLRIAHETFEAYFASRGHSLADYLRSAAYLLPVVHAEADFKAPLAVGDALRVSLSRGGVGNSSFTLATRIEKDDGTLVGTTAIVHAAVDRASGRKIALPDEVRQLVEGLGAGP